MKSRIEIAMDTANNNKAMITVQRRLTNDVRDLLVLQFIEALKGESSLCKIENVGETNDETGKVVHYRITPLAGDELESEYKNLRRSLGENMLRVPDNSDGFRDFLKSKDIAIVPDGHFTLIPTDDPSVLFNIGVSFGEYRAANQMSSPADLVKALASNNPYKDLGDRSYHAQWNEHVAALESLITN